MLNLCHMLVTFVLTGKLFTIDVHAVFNNIPRIIVYHIISL